MDDRGSDKHVRKGPFAFYEAQGSRLHVLMVPISCPLLWHCSELLQESGVRHLDEVKGEPGRG